MALIGRHDFASVAERGRLDAEAVHQLLNFGSILPAGGRRRRDKRKDTETESHGAANRYGAECVRISIPGCIGVWQAA